MMKAKIYYLNKIKCYQTNHNKNKDKELNRYVQQKY